MFKELLNQLIKYLTEMFDNFCSRCITIWMLIMSAKDMVANGEYSRLFLAIKGKIAIIVTVVWREIVSMFKEICDNWEAVIILICAVFGLIFLLGQVPLTIPTISILEADMVIPAIATLIVMVMALLMQFRTIECEE